MAEKNFATLDPTVGGQYIKRLLTNPFTRRQRVMALGEPGVGKSEMFQQVCDELGWILIDLRLTQLDVGAFRGLERIVDNPDGTTETKPVRPYFLPEYVAPEDITDATPRYLILLDEIMACDDAMRKSAFELLTNHRCGPHRLGENVVVCGAGNTAEDGTNVHEMDRATKRRFTYVGIHATPESFVAWGQNNGVHHAILSLVKNNPTFLMPSEEDFKNDNLATRNPASLVACSDSLKAYDAGYLTRDDLEYSLLGNIGMETGNELLLQMEDEDARFDLDALTNARKQDRVYPKNVFGVHSLGNALSGWATDGDRLDKAVDIMIGMPNESCSHAYEAKTAFILQIGDKITKFRRYGILIKDPEVLKLLDETGQMTKLHDEEFAAREAEEAAAQVLIERQAA
jgi:hypothetical protein